MQDTIQYINHSSLLFKKKTIKNISIRKLHLTITTLFYHVHAPYRWLGLSAEKRQTLSIMRKNSHQLLG